MSLLQMSVSGAVLILINVIIRAVAIHKLSKKTFLFLWGIALLRLLVPFSIPSMFSVYSFMNQSTGARVFEGTQIRDFIPVMPGEQSVPMKEKFADSSPSIWFVVWCIGMVFCIMFFAITYLYWYIQFQTALPVRNSYIEQWLKAHKLKRPLYIRQSKKAAIPLTYGIFRPVIVMPEDTEWENIKEIQYILLHEYVHVCHYDSVKKLISALALCIHWFNPLVWVMYILFDRDIELSCDESVVGKLGISEKSTYAKMLIGMEAKKSGLMPFCNSFNKNAIEERIEAIMRMKKATLLSLGAAVVIIAGIATTFATSAAENSTNSSKFDIDTVFDGDIDKERKYYDYIESRLASVIEEISGITDCEVDVSCSDGEIVFADVNVVIENDETDALKTDLLDYVSASLGISTKNITLSFN